MKVLHIFNELKYSGGETMIEIASEIFTKNNINTDILSTGSQVGVYKSKYIEKGYKVFHIPFVKFWRIISPFMLLKIYLLIKKNDYELVHVHPGRGRLSYCAVARLAKVKKIITTVHHIFVPSQTFIGKINVFINIFRRWFIRKIIGAIIVSNSQSGLRNEKIHYKSENIYIPNWYNHLKYTLPSDNKIRNKLRQELEIKDDNLVFVSLGGNWSYKNYDLIITAISYLGEHTKAIYLQIGPDEDKQLSKLTNELNLKNKVKLIGPVSDVIPFLYASDVYIMPSSIEGFGVAAVEAMGSGLPAILSNRPALYDFKDDSKEIVFTEPNANDIATAMKFFLKMDKHEIKKKGLLTSQSIMKKYGIENGAQKLVNLYLSNTKKF